MLFYTNGFIHIIVKGMWAKFNMWYIFLIGVARYILVYLQPRSRLRWNKYNWYALLESRWRVLVIKTKILFQSFLRYVWKKWLRFRNL